MGILDGNSGMPEVKVRLLPSSVALEVGTARVPAPLALALPSLPLESPHGASMLVFMPSPPQSPGWAAQAGHGLRGRQAGEATQDHVPHGQQQAIPEGAQGAHLRVCPGLVPT